MEREYKLSFGNFGPPRVWLSQNDLRDDDICVNKANPPEGETPAGQLSSSLSTVVLPREAPSSSFNNRFYLVNKTIIPAP